MTAAGLREVVGRVAGTVGTPVEPEPTDAELLRRYAAGDEDAFGVLTRRHSRLVVGLSRRRSPSGAADDVFQAVFIALSKNAKRLSSKRSVAGWLHVVTRRVASNARKQQGRRVQYEQAAARSRPEWTEPGLPDETLSAIDEELRALPKQFREVVVLRLYEELPLREIARRLDLPDTTARHVLARGLEALRSRLTHRGLTAPAVAVALVSPQTAAVAVPPGLVRATLEAVSGQSIVSPALIALAQGAARAGLVTKQWAAVALVATLTAGGGGYLVAWGSQPGPAGQHSEQHAAEQTVNRPNSVEELVRQGLEAVIERQQKALKRMLRADGWRLKPEPVVVVREGEIELTYAAALYQPNGAADPLLSPELRLTHLVRSRTTRIEFSWGNGCQWEPVDPTATVKLDLPAWAGGRLIIPLDECAELIEAFDLLR
jgi:RNA polymerase sigma factor (sigma-70 family)